MERPSTDLQGTPEFLEWWQLATRFHGLEGEYELHDDDTMTAWSTHALGVSARMSGQ